MLYLEGTAVCFAKHLGGPLQHGDHTALKEAQWGFIASFVRVSTHLHSNVCTYMPIKSGQEEPAFGHVSLF